MLLSIIAIIALISILMACYSLWRQSRIEEIKGVKKELQQQKVIFHRDESRKK